MRTNKRNYEKMPWQGQARIVSQRLIDLGLQLPKKSANPLLHLAFTVPPALPCLRRGSTDYASSPLA
jgi:hypothetical protein